MASPSPPPPLPPLPFPFHPPPPTHSPTGEAKSIASGFVGDRRHTHPRTHAPTHARAHTHIRTRAHTPHTHTNVQVELIALRATLLGESHTHNTTYTNVQVELIALRAALLAINVTMSHDRLFDLLHLADSVPPLDLPP